MFYRREIDGLRAIAVIPVLFFHAGFSNFSGGFVGVDIFFVISGYLISSLLMVEIKNNKFSITHFYERRARRLLPALFLVMSITIFFAWSWLLPEELIVFHQSFISALLFISNIFFWQTTDYFAISNLPLLHTWSLAVEEQFYIIFPIFLFLIWRFEKNTIFIVTCIILIISLLLSDWASTNYPVANFYLLPTRGWELLTGVLISLFLFNRKKDFILNSKFDEIFAILGLLLITFSVYTFDSTTPFPGRWTLIPVIGTAMVVLFATQNTLTGKFLGFSPFVGIGLLSYSLYLWHYPLFVFAEIRMLGDVSTGIYVCLICISLALSYLSWRFIEGPFRDRRNNFKNNTSIKVFSLSFILIIIFFLLLNGKSPSLYLSKNSPDNVFQDLYWPDSQVLDKDCQKMYGANQYCLINDINLHPTDALIGDSHANHFYPGLRKYLSSKGRNLLMQGGGGCPPFFDVDRGIDRGSNIVFKCQEFLKEPYKNILENKNIETIYLAFHHSFYFSEDFTFIDKKNEILSGSNFQKSSEALLRTINDIEKAGKKAILLYDLPDLDLDIDFRSCIRSKYIFQENKGCMKESFLFNFSQYDDLIEELENKTDIKVFNTHEYLNNFPIKDGSFFYRDETHLSTKGSLYLSRFYDF